MKKEIFLTSLLLTLLVSCNSQASSDTESDSTPIQVEASATADPEDSGTIEATATAEPGAPTPEPTEFIAADALVVRMLLDGEALQSSGPWLMFKTDDGFWLLDHNGEEAGFFKTSDEYWPIQVTPAPQGGYIAISYSDQ